MDSINILWFKNDLRLKDNQLFFNHQNTNILPIFIINSQIKSYSLWWLLISLQNFIKDLQSVGLDLLIIQENNHLVLLEYLKKNYKINSINFHHSYESFWINSQNNIIEWCQNNKILWNVYNNNFLRNPSKIFNSQGSNYKVFSPFWKSLNYENINKPLSYIINYSENKVTETIINQWKKTYNDLWVNITDDYKDFLYNHDFLHNYWNPSEENSHNVLNKFVTEKLNKYKDYRSIPSLNINSYLSPFLRTGQITPNEIYWAVKDIDPLIIEPFLRQLGWRDFSYHLLHYYPQMVKKNLRPEFDKFPWRWDDNQLFTHWTNGTTGYPIIDAGMNQLKKTGWIHNRVRLIVGSFLTKDLKYHWTMGEKYFWEYLIDADEANNAASWQWVAGSGSDAAPYYRIFNPTLQSLKLDKNGDYIRQWVPVLQNVPREFIHEPWKYDLKIYGVYMGDNYPWPIIDHKTEKDLSLMYYKNLTGKEDSNG